MLYVLIAIASAMESKNYIFVTSKVVLTATRNMANTRHIHKISSVRKYCRCSAEVTMMRMHAESVGPFGRQGCHLQTIELHLRIVLCVYNVQENREARCM
jgi:hypothetical protein